MTMVSMALMVIVCVHPAPSQARDNCVAYHPYVDSFHAYPPVERDLVNAIFEKGLLTHTTDIADYILFVDVDQHRYHANIVRAMVIEPDWSMLTMNLWVWKIKGYDK